MRTIRPTGAFAPQPNRGAVHARLTRAPIPWLRDDRQMPPVHVLGNHDHQERDETPELGR